MSTLLFPELLREQLESSRRALQRYPGASLTVRDVEDAAFVVLSAAGQHDRFWQRFLADLAGGLPADRARLQAETLLQLCDSVLAICKTVVEMAGSAPSGEKVEGLAELHEWSAEVSRRRTAASRLLAAATAPPPPFDRTEIAESNARWARGEDTSEDIDDIIARLEAGGRP
jgi:hypothetical protein